MVRERQKEQGMDEEDEKQYERKAEDYEPKFWGVSLKSTPLYLKLAYLLAIVAFFGGLIAFGLHKLTPKEAPAKKKSKKAKGN